MNGWYAVCLFTDSSGGMLASDGAKITVKDSGGWATNVTPTATPKPTPEVIEVTVPDSSPAPTTSPSPTTSPDPNSGNEGGGTGGEGGGTNP